ncbi:MAG: ATP-binding protein [Elusimicrobia bacterium]|nr:ATP-binding protein [Elusimicrobiota bacterium]
MALKDAERTPTAAIPSLVKELVDQFDEPLNFYRELIQNSIDAGSNRIDVALEYREKEGRAVIHVEDDGEGMDENVINNYLLVLFKSTKEDDFTKIGKFGIGFVSVFAPQPDMVRLYTAKNGQSWRLDFPSYKRYDLYRMPEMREGTLVELLKRMGKSEYAKFVEASKAVILHWCRHSDTKIFFEDRSSGEGPKPINEPFDVAGGVSVAYAEEGTEIVLGYSEDEKPFFGFYNKGLTLKEGRQVFHPGVQFKVKSRYLEHTLTRDNVIEDENYQKAMAIVERLVTKELPRKLRAELGELAARAAAQAADAEPKPAQAQTPLAGAGASEEPRPEGEKAELWSQWRRRAPFLRWLFSGWFAQWRNSDWDIFPSASGKAVSLKEVWRRAKDGDALVADHRVNRVTRALERQGTPVLVAGPWIDELAAWHQGKLQVKNASESYALPVLYPEAKLPPFARALLATLRELDETCGAKYKDILMADFTYPGSAIQERIFITQKEPGELLNPAERIKASFLGLRKPAALLNAAHPFVRRLFQLHPQRPGFAGYLCLKLLHLIDGEVPADQKGAFCNMAEKIEARLLKAALRMDSERRRQPARR